jgi:hypothetical protein
VLQHGSVAHGVCELWHTPGHSVGETCTPLDRPFVTSTQAQFCIASQHITLHRSPTRRNEAATQHLRLEARGTARLLPARARELALALVRLALRERARLRRHTAAAECPRLPAQSAAHYTRAQARTRKHGTCWL